MRLLIELVYTGLFVLDNKLIRWVYGLSMIPHHSSGKWSRNSGLEKAQSYLLMWSGAAVKRKEATAPKQGNWLHSCICLVQQTCLSGHNVVSSCVYFLLLYQCWNLRLILKSQLCIFFWYIWSSMLVPGQLRNLSQESWWSDITCQIHMMKISVNYICDHLNLL